jgi:hypothetical protein
VVAGWAHWGITPLVVILSEAMNPSWFTTKDEEGFFARRGGLRMTVFGIFRQVGKPV